MRKQRRKLTRKNKKKRKRKKRLKLHNKKNRMKKQLLKTLLILTLEQERLLNAGNTPNQRNFIVRKLMFVEKFEKLHQGFNNMFQWMK